MDKFYVKCIKEVPTIFTEGKVYLVFWDNDDNDEHKLLLLVEDDLGNENHIIAEHTLEDEWFKEHFELS